MMLSTAGDEGVQDESIHSTSDPVCMLATAFGMSNRVTFTGNRTAQSTTPCSDNSVVRLDMLLYCHIKP